MSFDFNFIGILIGAIMASSVPLILAASGELITERSGVLNLGVEGIMISLFLQPQDLKHQISQ